MSFERARFSGQRKSKILLTTLSSEEIFAFHKHQFYNIFDLATMIRCVSLHAWFTFVP